MACQSASEAQAAKFAPHANGRPTIVAGRGRAGRRSNKRPRVARPSPHAGIERLTNAAVSFFIREMGVARRDSGRRRTNSLLASRRGGPQSSFPFIVLH